MNGPIAQLVALACHANATGITTVPYWPGNSTCQFCRKINFVIFKKSFPQKSNETEIAANPNEWITHLHNLNLGHLRLFHLPQNDPRIPDRMSAGFIGGGGTWGISVPTSDGKCDHWMARWQVSDRDSPDNKIWSVTYGRVSENQPLDLTPSDLKREKAVLGKALGDVLSFAEQQNLKVFADAFGRALDTIRSGNSHGYHKDLAPDGVLLPDARILLDACQSAWMFGGMGSWNDIGFEEPEQTEYTRVSDQLFEAINHAIVASANAQT